MVDELEKRLERKTLILPDIDEMEELIAEYRRQNNDD